MTNKLSSTCYPYVEGGWRGGNVQGNNVKSGRDRMLAPAARPLQLLKLRNIASPQDCVPCNSHVTALTSSVLGVAPDWVLLPAGQLFPL